MVTKLVEFLEICFNEKVLYWSGYIFLYFFLLEVNFFKLVLNISNTCIRYFCDKINIIVLIIIRNLYIIVKICGGFMLYILIFFKYLLIFLQLVFFKIRVFQFWIILSMFVILVILKKWFTGGKGCFYLFIILRVVRNGYFGGGRNKSPNKVIFKSEDEIINYLVKKYLDLLKRNKKISFKFVYPLLKREFSRLIKERKLDSRFAEEKFFLQEFSFKVEEALKIEYGDTRKLFFESEKVQQKVIGDGSIFGHVIADYWNNYWPVALFVLIGILVFILFKMNKKVSIRRIIHYFFFKSERRFIVLRVLFGFFLSFVFVTYF